MFGTRVKGWGRSDVEDEAEKVKRQRTTSSSYS